jgi:ATP-dependent Clp protease ATP-binding subunit ClpC
LCKKATPTNPNIKLSRDSKRALAYAAEEAERLRHRHIGIEHLFLGILRERGSSGEELLRRHGTELSKLREAVAKESGQISTSPQPKRHNFSFLNRFRRKSEKIEIP